MINEMLYIWSCFINFTKTYASDICFSVCSREKMVSYSTAYDPRPDSKWSPKMDRKWSLEEKSKGLKSNQRHLSSIPKIHSFICRCYNIKVNPLSPNIHIQILQTDLHTFPWRISWENLICQHFLFSDHFINSHNLISWQGMNIVGRKLMLVTIGT